MSSVIAFNLDQSKILSLGRVKPFSKLVLFHTVEIIVENAGHQS